MQSSFSMFKSMAAQGNIVPVYEEFLGDRETPLSLYIKIRDQSYSFLLESADNGKKQARFSFIGFDPFVVVRSIRDRVEILDDGKPNHFVDQADPFPAMREIMRKYKSVRLPDLPRFQGGMVGFLNYDLVRTWESLPGFAPPDDEFPEAAFMAPRRLVVFDHVAQRVKVVVFVLVDPLTNLQAQYDRACRAASETAAVLQAPAAKTNEESSILISALKSNFSKKKFEEAVEKAKEYIRAGDIFQVVLSQRFSAEARGDDFSLYGKLRNINPSPYMFYLHFDRMRLIGSSPEILVRMIDRKIEYRPIAGTRPRGANDAEDRLLKQDLMRDEKERAEHIMLVDLGRNDVGRVAEPGTVQVPQLMEIEYYSHVMHIVSQVEGRLRSDRDGFDLFRSAFPAGTVSGAPKIRAMEIIRELEPCRRGPYAGAVGIFDFNGDLDFCITIRTMLLKDNKLTVQVGAGIVYDSIPEREYEETLKKAGAMFAALGVEPLHDFDD